MSYNISLSFKIFVCTYLGGLRASETPFVNQSNNRGNHWLTINLSLKSPGNMLDIAPTLSQPLMFQIKCNWLRLCTTFNCNTVMVFVFMLSSDFVDFYIMPVSHKGTHN